MSSSLSCSVEYRAAIKASIRSARFFFFITAIASFLYGSRTAIWVSYGQLFDDFSINMSSWILYIDSILIGIDGIFFSSLSDYIGFDKSMTLQILLIAIGCGIEAFATNFKLLCIGFLLSQTATWYVTLGYIAWILPTKYAKTEITLLYGLQACMLLIGPIFSGIIFKLFQNYRIIFVINCILIILLFIWSLIFIYDKQQILENRI